MPDGRIGRFEVPEGTTPEQAQSMISASLGNQAAPTQDIPALNEQTSPVAYGASKVVKGALASAAPAAGEAASTLGSAAKNFIPSAIQYGKDIAHAVTNPVETVKGVFDIGAGTLQNVLPERLVQAIGEDKESRQKASAVADFYKQRYGSLEGFKEAVAKDPVSVLSDLSLPFTGGGAVAAKIPVLAKTGQVMSKVGATIDPLVMTLRGTEKVASGTGKVASRVLGIQAGAGDEPVRQAFAAGKVGGENQKSFIENMRGEVPMQDVLDTAKSDLAAMGQQQKAAYRSDMKAIKNDKTILDFNDVDDAFAKTLERTEYKGQARQGVSAQVEKAREIVDNWKNLDPAEYHTPEGFDFLKQQIGDVLETIPFEQANARAAVGDIYNSVKSTIGKQAPKYAEVMKNYSDAAETMREIERALSLGKKASADTAMRKLQSLMRNNVNNNYGQRLSLAKQLEEAGGKQIMPALAGQALSEWTPRGLQRAAAAPSAYLAYMAGGVPYAVASGLSSSPRLVGEAALKAGQLARGLRAAKGAANALPIPPNVLANALYQAGVNTQGFNQ